MILDLIMTILLPLLMIQALTGEKLHEWIGYFVSDRLRKISIAKR